MTRNGKIARLPRLIRDELNRRLDDGEEGATLLDWLNGHPDVQRVLAESFEGRTITHSNLSDWKVGGFEDWKHLQEACDWARTVSTEADHVAAESGLVPLSDRLSATVSLALGKLLREVASGALTDPASQDKFMDLLKQLTRLRRHDHSAARLRMTLEHHELSIRDRLRMYSLPSIPIRPLPA